MAVIAGKARVYRYLYFLFTFQIWVLFLPEMSLVFESHVKARKMS